MKWETYRGVNFVLNPILLARQKIETGGQIYDALVESHRAKFDLMERMASVNDDDRFTLSFYADLIDQLEFLQQRLWGVPLDPLWHLFWLLPHCRCPEEANADRWYRLACGARSDVEPIYAIDCPIHGTQ